MFNKVTLDWSTSTEIDDELFPKDTLDRVKHAQFLTSFLAQQSYTPSEHSENMKNNYVLNLNSEWGSGKTYFLKRWSHDLKAHFPVVYIDAWQQDYSDFRLTQKKFSDDPFNPLGVRRFGGRWNNKGTDALYFAESESLSTLEVFVHVSHHPDIMNQYKLYCIKLPDHLIARLEKEDLPSQWRAIPFSESTQVIGDEFLTLADNEFAALQVPSMISPRDYNYLVNPNHPAMKAVLASAVKLDFEFDPRIFK